MAKKYCNRHTLDMSMYDLLDNFLTKSRKFFRGFFLFSYGLLVVINLLLAVVSLSPLYAFVFLMSCVIALYYYAGSRLFKPPSDGYKVDLRLITGVLIGSAWLFLLIWFLA